MKRARSGWMWVAFACLVCLTVAFPTRTQAVTDFSGPVVTAKMGKTLGNRPVLAVLWNPQRPGEVVPSAAAVDAMLFGAKPSVKDWYNENSGNAMVMVRAGVAGWFKADKPWQHYWNENQATDTDGDGWLNGHVEKWAEAIRKADAGFNFAPYDKNQDGVLSQNELGILVVIPQNSPFGTLRSVVGRQAPSEQPLIVDGKRIDVVTEWYTGNPLSFAIPAHELAHLLLGAPDMYQNQPWKFAADTWSMMDDSWSTWHLDPFNKLKSGWLRVTAAIGQTEYSLANIEKNQEALILYDPRRGPGEYFVLENRWKGASYDAGPGGWTSIASQGLLIWRVLEDPALFPLVNPQPNTDPGTWGRNGILLLRRNGGAPLNDALATFSAKGTVLTSATSPVSLKWLDGSASGFRVELLTGAAATMRLKITAPVGSRIHRAAAGNTVANYTYLADPYTTNSHTDLLFVTANWNPVGSTGVYNASPTGVWYDTTRGQWAVFNQNTSTAMSAGAAFNYRVEVTTTAKSARLHKATAGNSTGNWTVINHALANGQPGAILQVTSNWNPTAANGIYNNHNIGVFYDGARWAVFNQDLAAITPGAAFNVRVGLGAVHRATIANIISHRTVLNNAQFNGKPAISLLVTPNWNPGGVGGTYNDHPIGVWYNSGTARWEIFNQDLAAMPEGAAFNVALN